MGGLNKELSNIGKEYKLFPYPREVNGMSYKQTLTFQEAQVLFPYPLKMNEGSYLMTDGPMIQTFWVPVPYRGEWGVFL